MLNDAGFQDTEILASNELDETLIAELKRQGAQITMWGVGTNLVTSRDQPALDGVYKLSAIRNPGESWKYKLKLSEQMVKISNPGVLQVRRYFSNELNIADVMYDIFSPPTDSCVLVDAFDPYKRKILSPSLNYKDLLVPIFKEGRRVYELPTLQEIKNYTKSELAHFQVGIKRFINPHQYLHGWKKNCIKRKSISFRRSVHTLHMQFLENFNR